MEEFPLVGGMSNMESGLRDHSHRRTRQDLRTPRSRSNASLQRIWKLGQVAPLHFDWLLTCSRVTGTRTILLCYFAILRLWKLLHFNAFVAGPPGRLSHARTTLRQSDSSS
jgi:hypothetical protein